MAQLGARVTGGGLTEWPHQIKINLSFQVEVVVGASLVQCSPRKREMRTVKGEVHA